MALVLVELTLVLGARGPGEDALAVATATLPLAVVDAAILVSVLLPLKFSSHLSKL